MNYDDHDMTGSFDDEEEKIYLNEQQKKMVSRFGGCFLWICVLPFMLAGIVFVIVGTTQYFKAREKERICTELVKGIMTYENVNEEEMRDQYNNVIGNSRSYSGPRVVKYTYNRHEFTYKSSYYEDTANFKLNEEVEIYVDPAKPQNAYVPADKSNKKEDWLTLTIVGAIVSVISISVLLFNKIRLSKKLSLTDYF